MKYKFQSLLNTDKDDNIVGPMSPLMAAKEVCEDLGLARMVGLARVENNQAESTYDHLIIKGRMKDLDEYTFFCDMGTKLCPIALVYLEDPSVTITPIYDRMIEEMVVHRRNVELPKKSKQNPIMVLSKDDILNIVKQAEKSDAFMVAEYKKEMI